MVVQRFLRGFIVQGGGGVNSRMGTCGTFWALFFRGVRFGEAGGLLAVEVCGLCLGCLIFRRWA